ncbi:MAG: DNA alkylation repair protein [Blastocatellia bacterium]
MEFKGLMKELEAAGTAQNRKVYARHGAPADKMFGVSYANLYALRKRIKVDQALADRLWASGNHDARVLMTISNRICRSSRPTSTTARTASVPK